jgi:mannobiose 2-epimerase
MKILLEQEYTKWYPLTLDTVYGGYFSDLNYKWELEGRQDKMIVTQARHVWSTSNAVLYYQKDSDKFHKVAEHGFKYLRDVMWDKEYGGFYNLVNREGEPIRDNGEIIKQVYGNAFAVYGLAAYYKAFGDTAALNLATQTFNWIEKHSYDPVYGGYFEFMKRDGTALKDGFAGTPSKDQNCAIHLLEGFAELYKVWPDPLLKERLNGLLLLIRDKMIKNGETLQLFFHQDMTPVSYHDSKDPSGGSDFNFDHISFGHNVETTYLLLEASDILGIKDNSKTLSVGKKMDDYALENGWDNERGGIYDRGYIFNGENKVKIIKIAKEWWGQIEGANSFLLLSELIPAEKEKYYSKFLIQWEHIRKYLIDPKYGGWYWDSIDTTPDAIKSPKSSIWKCNYHTSRGLINCIKKLEAMK